MTEKKFDVRWERRQGRPVTTGGVTLTPEARVLTVRAPFGGGVWVHPSAVLVEEAGEERRVPILDVNRLVQVLGIALGAALTIVTVVHSSRKRRK
jgi:hypothetical protein